MESKTIFESDSNYIYKAEHKDYETGETVHVKLVCAAYDAPVDIFNNMHTVEIDVTQGYKDLTEILVQQLLRKEWFLQKIDNIAEDTDEEVCLKLREILDEYIFDWK